MRRSDTNYNRFVEYNSAVLPTAAAFGLGAAGALPVAREAMRTSPIPESTKYAAERLGNALVKRVTDTGRKEPQIALRPSVPEDTLGGKYEAITNPNKYASSGTLQSGNDFINYNPNASREIFAHELGHIGARNTDLGAFINKARHTPALSNSLAKAALMTIPAGTLAALNPGDEDIDESMALAALVSAPEVLDELNATRHGLGIMKDAGMPADRGQRARLAGAALSYMAVPLVMGGAANMTGNIFDEDQQTPGTITPN